MSSWIWIKGDAPKGSNPPPPLYTLKRAAEEFAVVAPVMGEKIGEVIGWSWVAFETEYVPFCNSSYDELPVSLRSAKEQAEGYIRKFLYKEEE